jgi:hypothetical protein
VRKLGDGREGDEDNWSIESGFTQWYLYDLATDKVLEDATQIDELVRCTPPTPRRCVIEHATLGEIRLKIEKLINSSYLRKVQAPVGVRPLLNAWMELN